MPTITTCDGAETFVEDRGVRAFSETDFLDDLERLDVPTLVIQGDDDQIVPLDADLLAFVKR